MQQKYYTIAFVDKTNGGVLSNAKVKTGTTSLKSEEKDTSVFAQVAGQTGGKLGGHMVNTISSVTGLNISPSVNLGKAVLTGAGAGAITSASLSIIEQVVSGIVKAISSRIAELKQEAAQANERDNVLILSGSLDISGYTIKKGKWGRDEYVYNRG